MGTIRARKIGGRNAVTHAFQFLTRPRHLGRWFGGWRLAMQLRTTAFHSIAAELRHNFRTRDEYRQYAMEHEQRGQKHYYRVKEG